MRNGLSNPARGGPAYHARQTGLGAFLGVVPIVLFVSFAAYFIYSRMGYNGMIVGLIGLFLGSIFAITSFRIIQVPVLAWLLSLMGFRALFFFDMPGLPDMTIDRVFMLWVVAVFAIKMIVEKKRLLGPYVLDTLIVVHGLYLLFSCLHHNPAAFNLWSKSYMMAYLAYFMGKNLVNDPKWVRVFSFVLVLLGVYYAETSIAENQHWNALVWPRWILDRSIGMQVPGRSRGIFLQSAVFGTVMAMILPFNFYFLRTARSWIMKGLYMGTIGLSVLGLYYTYTRGCWLAGLAALAAMVLIGLKKYLSLMGRFAVIAVILGAFGVMNPNQDSFYHERMENEGTVGNRVTVMVAAYQIFRENPILGSGFFTYRMVKDDYVRTVEVPILGLIKGSTGREASIHDIYMGVLAEEGLVGAFLLLGIYYNIFTTFRRKYGYRHKGDQFALYLMPAIGGLFVGYFVGGVAFDYRYFATIPSLFFLFVGIMAGYQPPPLFQAPSKIIATVHRIG